MNSTNSPYFDQHYEIQLLLPWYVNGSLNPDEFSAVEEHIRTCLVCRRELTALRRLSKAVTQGSDLELAAENSFANLTKRLAPRADDPTVVPMLKGTAGESAKPFIRRHPIRYAMAASILMAVLVPLGLHFKSEAPSDLYYTLSSAKQSPEGDLRVVFVKSASAEDISEVLAQLHGRQVGEVNSVGALTIRLNSGDGGPNLHQAVAMLRKRQDVLLVEPVSQP